MPKFNLSKNQLDVVRRKAESIIDARIEAYSRKLVERFDELVPADVRAKLNRYMELRDEYARVHDEGKDIVQALRRLGIIVPDISSGNYWNEVRSCYEFTLDGMLANIAVQYDNSGVAEALRHKLDDVELDLALMTCPDEVKAWLDSL